MRSSLRPDLRRAVGTDVPALAARCEDCAPGGLAALRLVSIQSLCGWRHGDAAPLDNRCPAAVRTIITCCRRKPFAVAWPDSFQEMRERGVNFLTLGSDAGFLRRGAVAEVTRAQEWGE